jgi:hypothetical protein
MFAAAAGRRGSVPPRYIFSIERRSGAYRPGNIPVLVQHAWNTSSVLFLDRVGTVDMEGLYLRRKCIWVVAAVVCHTFQFLEDRIALVI